MKFSTESIVLSAIVLACVVVQVGLSVAAERPPPTAAAAPAAELRTEAVELHRELDQLATAGSEAQKEQSMQHHWSLMQDYLREVRKAYGAPAESPRDWTLMDPVASALVQTGTDRSPAADPGGAWDLPVLLSPESYHDRLQKRFKRLLRQARVIAKERDPARRQAMLRGHYETVYRDLQTLRGNGWMWTASAAPTFKGHPSPGAALEGTYCSQCHMAPAPSLYTAPVWAVASTRMREHVAAAAHAPGSHVKVPSDAEAEEIAKYLARHAAA